MLVVIVGDVLRSVLKMESATVTGCVKAGGLPLSSLPLMPLHVGVLKPSSTRYVIQENLAILTEHDNPAPLFDGLLFLGYSVPVHLVSIRGGFLSCGVLSLSADSGSVDSW